MSDSRFFTFALILAFSLGVVLCAPAAAQDTEDGPRDAIEDLEFSSDPNFEPIDKHTEQVAPFIPKDDQEITVLEDKYAEEYLPGTVPNLSQLYWRLHVFDVNDDRAVDNFMLINECEIYQNFHDDDFEWEDIRNAGRDMLKEKKSEFSTKFKFLMPIDLGKYDTEKGGFELISNTAFKNMRRIEISGNSMQRDICGYKGEIRDYPRNIILILNKPFNFEFLELDEHVAQAFILRKKYRTEREHRNYRNLDYDRLAFVRIRVTFSQYQGNIKGRDGNALAVLYGRLDGIDIFEDPTEKQLLTSIDYEKPKGFMEWKQKKEATSGNE